MNFYLLGIEMREEYMCSIFTIFASSISIESDDRLSFDSNITQPTSRSLIERLIAK